MELLPLDLPPGINYLAGETIATIYQLSRG
jgi:hypothetical protein